MVKKKAATKKAATKKTVAPKAATTAPKKKATATKKAASKKTAASSAVASTITNEQRYKMVAEAAYHLSEKQGFKPGKDMDNWLKAEKQIEAELKKKNIQVK